LGEENKHKKLRGKIFILKFLNKILPITIFFFIGMLIIYINNINTLKDFSTNWCHWNSYNYI